MGLIWLSFSVSGFFGIEQGDKFLEVHFFWRGGLRLGQFRFLLLDDLKDLRNSIFSIFALLLEVEILRGKFHFC